jgi:uncharacterized protein
MIIDLDNIGIRPKSLELNVRRDEVDTDIPGTSMAANAVFQGETERVDGKAHIRGNVSTTVLIDCTRCLEPVEQAIDIDFDDVFVDPNDTPASPEVILSEDQLDEAIAPEGKVDLTEVVREQILLALPYQLFCREDCKGLCPKCGGNRNLIDCKCEENEIDPRWSALKGLR